MEKLQSQQPNQEPLTPNETFKAGLRKVLGVSKQELDKRDKKWHEQRQQAKHIAKA